MFTMEKTPDKSEAEPSPAQPASIKSPDTASAAVPQAPATPAGAKAPESKPAQDDLPKKAYGIYLKEGRPQGHDVQNWLEAETQMSHAKAEPPPAKPADAKSPEVASAAVPDNATALLQAKNGAEPSPAKPADAKSPDAAGAAAPGKAAALDTKPDQPSAPPAKHGFGMRNNIIFAFAIFGILAGLVAAYIFGLERKAQPPVFKPASSPYETAIFANGIIESDQPSGSNINIYPEVSGPITQVLVKEGQQVSAGAPLVNIDDSVQRATTEQLKLQAEAALSLLNELKAEPRKETLAIAEAQVEQAEANLKAARDQYDKRRASYDIDPKSISKDVLDTAADAVTQAAAALDVARTQYELTKAGAWSYDIVNQQKQYEALQQSYKSAVALLQYYSIKAPADGVVLAVNTTPGSYVSSQGAYNPYTELFDPIVLMGAPQDHLAVRCYVDEILVSRLPSSWHIRAQMSVRGSDVKVPLEFVRVQPYVSPKIELSNERQEQVDLMVLPVIFRFEKKDAPVYPGQLVDVYIGQE
jgi:HlyD family secretion protein